MGKLKRMPKQLISLRRMIQHFHRMLRFILGQVEDLATAPGQARASITSTTLMVTLVKNLSIIG